jgi:predicted amidohydrolase YtcJ
MWPFTDAGGATVLPGFIESHVHLFQGAAELDALNLFDVNGADSLKDTVENMPPHAATIRCFMAYAAITAFSARETDIPARASAMRRTSDLASAGTERPP